MAEQFYPTEESLGENCLFWDLGSFSAACCFPKAELKGRRSCEGIVDTVCLFVKNRRPTTDITPELRLWLRTNPPDPADKSYLPPGNVA